MHESDDGPAPRGHPDLLDLVEQIGVSKVADEFGIYPSAVRQWRKKGVPATRRDALLTLAAAEGKLPPATEEPSAVEEEPDAEDSPPVVKHQSPGDNSLPRRNQSQEAEAATVRQRKSVRLNRQTVLIVGIGLTVAIAFGLTQGLRGITGSLDHGQIEEREETLIFQPLTAGTIPEFSYTDVTKIAVAEPRIGEEPKSAEKRDPEPRRPSPTPAAERLTQEDADAFRSPLFPSGALALRQQTPTASLERRQLSGLDGLSLDLPSPQDLFPGRQPSAAEQQESFLQRQPDDRAYLQSGLQPPLSTYEVKAGTVIPAALITGLNSDLPGEIVGQVTEHVYDTVTGNHLLIPQGARILGRYNADIGFAQERAQIVWDRLIMPNGSSVQLESMVGTDKAGYAGLADQVDHHLGRLIGAVILSSVISAGANLATDSAQENSFIDDLGDSAAQQAATIGSQIVDRQLDVLPTITIRPGFKLNILVNKDVILEPYEGA